MSRAAGLVEFQARANSSGCRPSSAESGIAFASEYVIHTFTHLEEHAMLNIRTILHPTDFSENSDYAFRLACALARDYGARLLVLHVATPPPVVGYAEGIMIPEPAESHELIRQRLQQLRASEPEIEVEHRLVEGDGATEILQTARDTKCDLIVIGTHGRTGLIRLLMGSVAEQVVRRAACPVMTVRQPLPEARVSGENAAKSAAMPAGAAKG
jgi:nucleotide-binding universal stress UspA family protein